MERLRQGCSQPLVVQIEGCKREVILGYRIQGKTIAVTIRLNGKEDIRQSCARVVVITDGLVRGEGMRIEIQRDI